MIVLSVGLPIFNSREIAWLALESLCRQKGINFDWELIIAEEQDENTFGEATVYEYADRLKEVGCKRIHYEKLSDWILLSKKWEMIFKLTSPSSKFFLFQAADNYSQPHRLSETYNSFIKEKCDWVSYQKSMFYIIRTGEIIVNDHTTMDKQYPFMLPGLNMSTRTKYLRKMPSFEKRSGMDRWMFNYISTLKKKKIHVVRIRTKYWDHGMFTHGLNNLSKNREKALRKRYKERLTIEQVKGKIPIDILDKLKSCKDKVRW